MVVALVEIVAANAQRRLNFKHALCSYRDIWLVYIRHHVHIVDEAEDRRVERDVDQLAIIVTQIKIIRAHQFSTGYGLHTLADLGV